MPIIPMPISRRRGFTAVGWGATLPAFGVTASGIPVSCIRRPGVRERGPGTRFLPPRRRDLSGTLV